MGFILKYRLKYFRLFFFGHSSKLGLNIISVFHSFHNLTISSTAGFDGKCGMAAITLTDKSSSLNENQCKDLFKHCEEYLASYARPRFVRMQKEMTLTGTFKQQKFQLVKSGFDPSQVDDPLYFYDSEKSTYSPLTDDMHEAVVSGRVKMWAVSQRPTIWNLKELFNFFLIWEDVFVFSANFYKLSPRWAQSWLSMQKFIPWFL